MCEIQRGSEFAMLLFMILVLGADVRCSMWEVIFFFLKYCRSLLRSLCDICLIFFPWAWDFVYVNCLLGFGCK